ncbi:MAG: hypothetical protein ACYCO4_07650 [Sulfobacillus sp.]
MAETTDGVQWHRLRLGVGAVAVAYTVLLQPVASSLRALDASYTHQAQMVHEIQVLEQKNLRLEATIKRADQSLHNKARVLAQLSAQLTAIQRQEQTISAQIQISAGPTVTLPSTGGSLQPVTTTGASGKP